MNALGFVKSWLEDTRRVSDVDGADAVMMQDIQARLEVMEGLRLPRPVFYPGDPVKVGGEIEGRVEQVSFRRGSVKPFYQVCWWDHSERVFEWFIETDLSPSDA